MTTDLIERNLLEEERLNFTPPLPLFLNKVNQIEAEAAEILEPAADKQQLKALFPHTFGRPLINLRSGRETPSLPRRVGTFFSGGQAAGGHNVVTGLFDALKKIHVNASLFGFLNGPRGVIENHYLELHEPHLARYRNCGGFDLLGSGRTKIETAEQMEAALRNCQELRLDGLVVIGGDDSNTNAAFLAEYFLAQRCPTRVIGVPKTIDGDLRNRWVEISFGFDTACKTYSELIGNIARDALSAKKYYHFIKLMGRSASHITLECALATHPNLSLIGEEVHHKKMGLEQITDEIANLICKRWEKRKEYGVILIPEGLIEFIPDFTAQKFPSFPIARDPHGNIEVSKIATEQLLIYTVTEELKKRSNYKGKFSPVSHFLGYEGRSAFPSNFDATYCYALGHVAAALINCDQTGYMCALQNLNKSTAQWEGCGVPLTGLLAYEWRNEKKIPVVKKALVNLEGKAFKYFAENRECWEMEDDYRYPGPIQFSGSPGVCNGITATLALQAERD